MPTEPTEPTEASAHPSPSAQDLGRKLADMLHQRAQRARAAEVAKIVHEWLQDDLREILRCQKKSPWYSPGQAPGQALDGN